MRRYMCRILCIITAVLLFTVCSLAASAENHSATLNALHFDIVLQKDGSAEITETREVSFAGNYEYTRYGFSNRFTGPRIFEDWKVTMDGRSLTMLDEPDNESRPENTFAVENGDGQNTVYLYHRSENIPRSFQISYRVENAVKLYDDVGEFHWNLTGEDGISSIGMVTAVLTIPDGVPEGEFRIWAHGPLNGTFEKQDGESAYLQVEWVPTWEIVDLRTTIPVEYFTGGWEQEGEALPAILSEEKELADSANAKREEEARLEAEREQYWAEREAWEAEHPVQTAIQGFCEDIYDFFYFNIEDQLLPLAGFGGFVIFVLTALFGGRKFDQNKMRRKPLQSPQYYCDLPDDRPAPAVDHLLHYYPGNGNADTSRQISSAMLELNLKKLIQFHTGAGDTEIILNEQLGQDEFLSSAMREKMKANRSYSVKLRRVGDETIVESQSGSAAGLEVTYLEIVWKFLQSAAEDTGRIRVKELKQYVKDHQESAYHFRKDFEQAVRREHAQRVQPEALKGLRFTQRKLLWIAPVLIGILAVLVRMLCTLYDGMEIGASLTVGAIAFAVTLFFGMAFHLGKKLRQGRSYILDQQSENALALWQAFGRFLDDFTTFDKKELPEFPVWRKYMVYAVAMGKGQKVAKTLAVKYPEYFSEGSSYYDDEYYRMLEEMRLYEELNALSQEVAAAAPPKASPHSDRDHGTDGWSDNWSDSDGGGGGFSDSGGGSDSGSSGDFAD